MDAVEHGKYPDAFYKTSIVAIIKNSKAELLAVKDQAGTWLLPEAELEHGKDIHYCFEWLMEDLGIHDEFTETFSEIDTKYVVSDLDRKNDFWKMTIYYELNFDNGLSLVSDNGLADRSFLPVSTLQSQR